MKSLNELGQPGTLYFIAQTDSEGNQNYSYVSSTGDTGTDYAVEQDRSKNCRQTAPSF